MCTALAFIAMACLVVPAFGYDEVASGKGCVECHGTGDLDDITAPVEPSGPHGGYSTTSRKCATCHTVHAAPSEGVLLLPAATIEATCMTCHDGTITNGQGVYGAIEARTSVPAVSDHSIDSTNTVPGGDATSGASQDRIFNGSGTFLTCSDCHSPHGNAVVNPFTGDRARSTADGTIAPVIESSRLLKQRPTSYSGDPIADYGSDWCGACHAGRLSGSGMPNNHPVESSENLPDASSLITSVFTYDSVARFSEATTGTLGGSNLGYIMADPRVDPQFGHTPICQQCHEDARDAYADFSITAATIDGLPDGPDATYSGANPRFQTFPHESQVNRLLVSEWPDSAFCTKCHTDLP